MAAQRSPRRSADGRPGQARAVSGDRNRRGGPPDRGHRSRRMKKLLAGLILLVTFPPLVGSAAVTIATAPHPAPAVRLFPWVPSGGYPDRFPYGWCTWWAAYNRHVTWNGNAADWLENASAQGFKTAASP